MAKDNLWNARKRVLTPAQLDKLVELHDRRGMTYRALGVRYGISEKMEQRLARAHKEGASD